MPQHRATRPTTNWKHWIQYLRHYWHPTTVNHRRQRAATGQGIGRHQPSNNTKN